MSHTHFLQKPAFGSAKMVATVTKESDDAIFHVSPHPRDIRGLMKADYHYQHNYSIFAVNRRKRQINWTKCPSLPLVGSKLMSIILRIG